MSTRQMTIGIISIILTVIIAVAGGTWAISEKINTSHVELLEENAKTRDELRKEIGELRVEFHKNIGELRGDIEKLDSKLDEFIDSHEREHDLFYGQGGR